MCLWSFYLIEEESLAADNENADDTIEEEPKSFIELIAKHKKELNEKKLQIALLSQGVIEDPEGKVINFNVLVFLLLKENLLIEWRGFK